MRKSILLVAGLTCSSFVACAGEINSVVDADTDQDGLTDAVEAELRTNPRAADTDNDGVYDGREHFFGSDPRRADSDGDGQVDGDEDFDGNGKCERDEHQRGPYRGGRHSDGGAWAGNGVHPMGDGGHRWPQGAGQGDGRRDGGTPHDLPPPSEQPNSTGERPNFSDEHQGWAGDGGAPHTRGRQSTE
jgi:hypothetical protein